MIRRSVRARFRSVYWQPPGSLPEGPAIIVPNHHGWYDGYLMFLALGELKMPFLDWVQEFEAFPLFVKVGGMPFPVGDSAKRAETIRKSVRAMQEGRRHLLMFGESVLHRPPEVWEIGKALDLVLKAVPGAWVLPVGIHYDMSLHERPEVWMKFGTPIQRDPEARSLVRNQLQRLLAEIHTDLTEPDPERNYEVLFEGTKDVNERLDMRKFRR